MKWKCSSKKHNTAVPVHILHKRSAEKCCAVWFEESSFWRMCATLSCSSVSSKCSKYKTNEVSAVQIYIRMLSSRAFIWSQFCQGFARRFSIRNSLLVSVKFDFGNERIHKTEGGLIFSHSYWCGFQVMCFIFRILRCKYSIVRHSSAPTVFDFCYFNQNSLEAKAWVHVFSKDAPFTLSDPTLQATNYFRIAASLVIASRCQSKPNWRRSITKRR